MWQLVQLAMFDAVAAGPVVLSVMVFFLES
jgi:hypothetical protein